jgi:hypothetical protein
MRLSLDKLTKTALKEMVEDAIFREAERGKPAHRRSKDKPEKDEPARDADEEGDALVVLVEEMRGSPSPVDMDDEDMSDEAMQPLREASDEPGDSDEPEEPKKGRKGKKPYGKDSPRKPKK